MLDTCNVGLYDRHSTVASRGSKQHRPAEMRLLFFDALPQLHEALGVLLEDRVFLRFRAPAFDFDGLPLIIQRDEDGHTVRITSATTPPLGPARKRWSGAALLRSAWVGKSRIGVT